MSTYYSLYLLENILYALPTFIKVCNMQCPSSGVPFVQTRKCQVPDSLKTWVRGPLISKYFIDKGNYFEFHHLVISLSSRTRNMKSFKTNSVMYLEYLIFYCFNITIAKVLCPLLSVSTQSFISLKRKPF